MEESFEKVVSKFAGNFVNLWLQFRNLVRGSNLLQSPIIVIIIIIFIIIISHHQHHHHYYHHHHHHH